MTRVVFDSNPIGSRYPNSRRHMAVGGRSFAWCSVGFAEPVVACELGGGLLAITAGALAFFATLYNRRRAQEKLRETSRQAEAKFEALAENAQDAIVSADSRGNIIYFNKAAQRAFGYEASEVLGKPLTLLMPERFRDQHLAGHDTVSSPEGNRTSSEK